MVTYLAGDPDCNTPPGKCSLRHSLLQPDREQSRIGRSGSYARDATPRQRHVYAASVSIGPGFDNGRIREIRWYGTRGITDPRGPRVRCTKPYRSMVFNVRDRFDFSRPVSSASRASDSGA